MLRVSHNGYFHYLHTKLGCVSSLSATLIFHEDGICPRRESGDFVRLLLLLLTLMMNGATAWSARLVCVNVAERRH